MTRKAGKIMIIFLLGEGVLHKGQNRMERMEGCTTKGDGGMGSDSVIPTFLKYLFLEI
jgi:hypothetical protein